MPSPSDSASIIVLHGDAEVLKSQALRRLLDEQLGADPSPDALLQFWGKEVSPVQMAAGIGAVSLFTEERVVVLREFQMIPLREQKPLEPALTNLPPGTVVVILSAPRAQDRDLAKPPIAAELMRVVKQKGRVEVFSNPRNADQLGGWVKSELAAVGKTIGPAALKLLLDRVGADYDRMYQEVQKLISYSGDEKEVTEAAVDVSALGEDDSTIFNFTDAIGKKDVPTALGIIATLMPDEASRSEAIGIVAQIARHLRLLWQANYALKRYKSLERLSEEAEAVFPDEHGLGKELRGKPFLARLLPQQARNFTEAQLARGMVKAYETDLALKGMSDEQMDERTLVETLVISLCRR